MTSDQKVALVESVKDTYGLSLALRAADLPKSTWYYHQHHKVCYEEKYAHLLPVLETIARQHPEYGVPRIMPELRDVHGYDVNHKVIERLLGLWDLLILRSTHRPKPSSVQQAIIEAGERANLVAQMEHIGLFQVLYTDFTELLYADGHLDTYHRSHEQDGVRLGRWRQRGHVPGTAGLGTSQGDISGAGHPLRRDDHAPRPRLGLYRLRVDVAVALEGWLAGLVCTAGSQGQS
jgi:hypothetical protein